MKPKLRIAYFYPNKLNLYGDNGNVEILSFRALNRGFDVEIIEVFESTKMDSTFMKNIDLVFMGGGPDSQQQGIFTDFLENKGPYLKAYVGNGGVGLFICGSYQLMGNYYIAADGSTLQGLGVFDLYTKHFGNSKPRCIGNVLCEISPMLRHDNVFNSVNELGKTLVGFENHGGRTYLGEKMLPLANVIQGHGNNSEDGTEGVLYKNSVGTYLHGPVLARNPHLADYLLAKALNLDELPALDDYLVNQAHSQKV